MVCASLTGYEGDRHVLRVYGRGLDESFDILRLSADSSLLAFLSLSNQVINELDNQSNRTRDLATQS